MEDHTLVPEEAGLPKSLPADRKVAETHRVRPGEHGHIQ